MNQSNPWTRGYFISPELLTYTKVDLRILWSHLSFLSPRDSEWISSLMLLWWKTFECDADFKRGLPLASSHLPQTCTDNTNIPSKFYCFGFLLQGCETPVEMPMLVCQVWLVLVHAFRRGALLRLLPHVWPLGRHDVQTRRNGKLEWELFSLRPCQFFGVVTWLGHMWLSILNEVVGLFAPIET